MKRSGRKGEEAYKQPIPRGVDFLTKIMCETLLPPNESDLKEADARAQMFEDETGITDREKLDILTGGGCQSCHGQIEPPGYIFEMFNDEGKYREEKSISAMNPLILNVNGIEGEYTSFDALMDYPGMLFSTMVSICGGTFRTHSGS